ncbi:endo-1,4-beta-xylanase [Acetivibrio cellulolyticus]|uniref:endo-1,4-beta-xylanase n=1 Tax=Acetivibrio cellulolyticus TaxID=35830 RepID=UPI0001E2DF03|nr:endo-1,4-beta-xylanase [Acetivibrio cellulolyticus]
MLKKKLATLLTACVITAVSIIGSFTTIADVSAGNLINDDFETGISGWGPRGDETVELSTEQAHSGTSSVKISNRTQTWNGAIADKSETLTLGETYTLSVYLKYVGDSYASSQRFSLQLQYNNGADVYKNIKTIAVNKGTWTLLEGQLTVPLDAKDVKIYVETEWKSSPSTQDLLDFYIDDFVAMPATLPEIEKDIASLKDVFSGYFKVGGAAAAGEIAPKPGKELFLKHYNSITFGNELKPDSVLDYNATIAYLEANPGDQVNPQVSLRAAKTLLDFARDNNIPVRGHVLVWHAQTPDWFFRENYSQDESAPWVSKEIMLQRLENYIKNVMELIKKEYPTVNFYAWDVVNEAVDPNTSTGMRNPGSNNKTSGNSLWMKTVGEDFIVKAFEYARKYAPADCKLFYNDYNEYEDKKMGYIVNILTNLKAKGLVDGMGMQSHWIMEYPSISMVENAVRKYNSLGLEVQLTEIDIKNTDNSASGLERQAERYQQFITKIAALKKEGLNITALVFWGVTDATSWLGGYPLLFNGEYKAKPAFYSIVKNITPIATSTVTPTATPKITPTPSSIVIGDVDGNKAVNSIDFGWVRKYLLGLSNSFPAGNDGLIAADVNGDGSINSLDYGWMRSKLLGMIEKFPAEE